MPNVAMPNGDVVAFPDAMPPDQIKGLIASKFPDETKSLTAPIQQSPVSDGPQQPPGFIQNVGNDIMNRANEIGSIDNQYQTGKQGLAGSSFDILGKGMGTIGDIAGEGIKSALQMAGKLPMLGGGNMSQGASQTISDISNTTPGKIALSALQQGGQVWDNFKSQNPILAQHIEAVGDIANAVPLLKGAETATMAAKSGLSDIADVATNAANDELSQPKPTIAQTREQQTASVRKSASDLYKDSNSQDISFDDNQTQDLNSAMSKLIPSSDLEQRSFNSSPASKQVQDITDSLSTENPTLNGMLAKRNEINSQIKVATRAGNDADAYHLNKVKDAMDETMMNGDTGTWQQANHQWAQQAILGDTDEIVNKALTKAQPANSLDTAVNNYLNSYKSNGLSDQEWQALKDVTNNSSFDKLRKGAASGLLKYTTGAAGAHFGVPGSVAGYLMGHYGSEFLKDSAMASKVAKLDDFRDMILSRMPPEIKPPVPKPEPLQLTDRGNAARISEAQQNAIQRLKEGRTGGGSIQKPQTGPMVGRPDGDVPYNYYSPNAPQRAITYQPLVSSDMKDVIGSNWNKLDLNEQKTIQDQVNQAWSENKIPLEDIIDNAKKDIIDLNNSKGQPIGSMADALFNAKTNKNISQQLRGNRK